MRLGKNGFRICARLIALALLALALCGAAAADEEEILRGEFGEDMTWELEDGVLTVSGSGVIEVDCWPYEMPWNGLRSEIVEVVITPGVTGIGTDAFKGCRELVRVSIPQTVVTIRDGAFLDCERLRDLSLPNGVTFIYQMAFGNCVSLTDLELPASLSGIAGYAFNRCSGLTRLVLSEGLESIGDGAFSDCTALDTVTIPASVTSIEGNPFSGCTSLSAIGVAPGSASFSSREGSLLSADGRKLIAVPPLFSGVYDVPDGVEVIGMNAFCACGGLTGITFPDGLTALEDFAVNGCDALTSVTLPASVNSLGMGLFGSCDGLTAIHADPACESYTSVDGLLYDKFVSMLVRCPCGRSGGVTIADGVQEVSEGAFMGCRFLTSITFPASIRSLYQALFDTCTSLTRIDILEGTDPSVVSVDGVIYSADMTRMISCPPGAVSLSIPASVVDIDLWSLSAAHALTAITVDPDNPRYASADGMLFSKDLTELIRCPGGTSGEVTVRDGVTTIGLCAFESCDSVTGVVLPAGVTTIGNAAFGDCDALARVDIPYTVSSIAASAFSSCSALTEITIPDGVGAIEDGTFARCSALQSVTIPGSVRSVCMYAFDGCTALSDVYFGASRLEWRDIMVDTGNDPLTDATVHYAQEVPLIDSGTLGDSIHWSLNVLGELTVGGTGAIPDFEWGETPWDPMESHTIIVEEGITAIGSCAFAGCDAWSFELPDSLERIGPSAFMDIFSPGTMPIPAGVTEIDPSAFVNCHLSRFSVDAGNRTYASRGGVLFTRDGTTLVAFPEEWCDDFIYTVPEGVDRIADYAFFQAAMLEEVVLPETLGSIGIYSFANCQQLRTVNLPDGLCTLGLGAFANDGSLTEVTLPDGLREIPHRAFTGTGLSSVAIPAGITEIGEDAFSQCAALGDVAIPAGVTAIGDGAFSLCQTMERIDVDPANPAYASVDGVLYDRNRTVLLCCPAGRDSLTLPETLTEIAPRACLGCSRLRKLSLPAGVTRIGGEAFCGCGNVRTLVLHDGVGIIGEDAFGACDDLGAVLYLGTEEQWASVSLGGGNGSLTGARRWCVTRILTLPDALTEIGDGAFADLPLIEAVRIPESVTVFGSGIFSGTNVLILCPDGSPAADWAEQNGYDRMEP